MSFFKLGHGDLLDLSSELREPIDWKAGVLRSIPCLNDVTTIAYDPLRGLLAVGTYGGQVWLFGRPGVESNFAIPEHSRIISLHFAISVHHLLVVDANDVLHIWNLSTFAKPGFVKSVRFGEPINSLLVSPSHTHAFIMLGSGKIKTYDLICFRVSRYEVPNIWDLHVRKSLAGPNEPDKATPLEMVPHPRDLTQVFICFTGGVIQVDLTKSDIIHAFEYMVPGGAPGGIGYVFPLFMKHRQPSVTAMAFHPAGHHFAVGYEDGSFAFWAVEDDSQPVLVCTIDDIDVNVINAEELETHMETRDNVGHGEQTPPLREPIYKLAWCGFPGSSDPRGGETVLCVLGGQAPNTGPGVTVIRLPALRAPDPPSSADKTALHSSVRKAIRSAVTPSGQFTYAVGGLPQDFLLAPKENPHFGGAYDPCAMFILSESAAGTRKLECFEFPPPSFRDISPKPSSPVETPSSAISSSDQLAEELESTLQAMKLDEEPQVMPLPFVLWTDVSIAHIFKIERDVYNLITQGLSSTVPESPLKGGVAWMPEEALADAKLAKFQPHQIIITAHRTLVIRFHDLSAQLLATSNASPIQSDFPNLLPHLTIDVSSVLADITVIQKTSPNFYARARIQRVLLSTRSLDLAVAFESGEILVYRQTDQLPDNIKLNDVPERILLVDHVPMQQGSKYAPYFMLLSSQKKITACSLSDIGFLAVAYAGGSLIILDLRGPRIIWPLMQDAPKRRQSLGIHFKSSVPPTIASLCWSICGLHSDRSPGVRLLATAEDNQCRIYSLIRNPEASWLVGSNVVETDGQSDPLFEGSWVLDSKTGLDLSATGERLANSLKQQPNDHPCIWISCGLNGAKSYKNINGDRIAKVDWHNKHGPAMTAQVVERTGSRALVVLTSKEALIYSLPYLEVLHTISLTSSLETLPSMDSTGDFIEPISRTSSSDVHKIMFSTLFNVRRAYSYADVDLTTSINALPPQPQPVSVGPTSVLSSWLPFQRSMTGEDLDVLLAGPERPIPSPNPSSKDANAISPADNRAAAALRAAQSTGSDLYSRLAAAVSERGQKLGDLDDSFQALNEGSQNMVSEAKRLAAEQSAKGWFGRF